MTDATHLSPGSRPVEGSVDRAAAFAAGPSRIPRKFVHWVLAAAAVLGIGGALLEHVLTEAGVNPSPPSVTTPARSSTPAALSSSHEHETTVPGTLPALMGLAQMTPGLASPYVLSHQRARPAPVTR
jgi:hypothetical protein